MKSSLRVLRTFFFTFVLMLLSGGMLQTALANIPGGGTGTGSNITVTDNGTTVTMANGIVSILCTKSGATINQINYTYNNNGSTQTINLLSGGNNGGQLYWETGGFSSGTFTETGITNTGSYAEITLLSTSSTNGTLEIHFSMLRGSPGFYVTAIWGHRASDSPQGMGETRDNIYSGSIFNWMSVDGTRNRLMEVSGGTAIGVQGAPVEVSMWINGIYSGQYEDKYKFSACLGEQRLWGWSSVGSGGKNVGLWNILGSSEYYNGGPLKRELMEHIGTTILNMTDGGHYNMGTDGNFANGEVWTKVYGPWFIYCNNVTNSITSTNLAAQALFNDAQAQAQAEHGIDTNGQPTGAVGAWPYYWLTNANYVPPSGRGTITGKIVINDSGNPNASAAGLWVGAVQQPSTTDNVYDFQQWMKPYQFWVKSDTNGNFTIPNVIATNNYTLYAFGPGAPGTFMSQAQTGGNPPLLYSLPSTPFSVTVAAGATNALGTVTWAPTRVGPTVFEIGYPDRTGRKFRHGEDYWVGDIGPSPATPSPIWSKWLEFPIEYPSGLNYVVGQGRWTTDWNFIQPVVTTSAGAYNNSSSTITFNLASAPAGGAQGSLYLALASDYYSAIIVTVNGTTLVSGSSVTGTPTTSIPSTGYYVGYGSSDSNIREGINAAASDERITFPGTYLHSGANTITIGIRQIGGSYFADHAIYDYIRLELTGYVPPAPSSVVAYAGNNCNLVCWPVIPGATSYKVFSTTTSGSGYSLVANGVTGPVCGNGTNNTTYLDTNAVNGTTYYYVVQSVNPTGTSANSPQSLAATPSSGLATNAPTAPTGLSVTSSGHQSVTLDWNVSSGANYYSIFRSTLVNSGGGSSNTLNTIILNNTNTGTSFTDTSPADGSIYSYSVTATSAGGTSSNSAPAIARPLPAAPASAPATLTAVPLNVTNITLNWSAVSGAIGYVISRATSVNGTYTLLQSVTETTYTDNGLSTNTSYYYKVTPMNDGGVATNGITTTRPAAPAGLSAAAAATQVTLTWPPSIGATGYVVLSGTSSGNATNIIVSGITTTNYTNTGLTSGTTYYYVVEAIGSAATSGNSSQASATTIPPAPAVLTATGTNTQVTLIWTTSAGATSYNVKRSTINGGPYVTNASPAATNYVDTGLANGTTYYYVVSAVNAAGQSANSAQASVITVPLAPAGLTATGGLEHVALSWNASVGATSYNVKRSAVSGGPYVTNASPSGTNYVDAGLADSTTYYYVVSAVNASGQSINSLETGATTITPITTTPTTTILNALGDAVTYGTPVTFAATVSPAPTAGDTVIFEDGSSILGTGTISGGGMATYTTSGTQLTAGSHSISAIFGGDANYLASSSVTLNQVVNSQTPVLSTVPTASAITYGQRLSASTLGGGVVTNAAGTTVPGTFVFDTTNIMPAPGIANQPVTFTPTDTNDYNPLAFGVSVTVNTALVTPVITLNSRVYDGTLTPATIATRTLTGVVGGDDVSLGTSGTVGAFTNQNAGSYTLNITGLSLSGTTAGNYSLTSASTTATGVITPAGSTTTLTSSNNPAAYEGDVTFNAVVAGTDTPTGSVQFLTNGVLFDTETLSGGMATSVDTTNLPPGTNVITALYSGDGNYLAGTNSLNQVETVAQFKALTNTGGSGLALGGSGGLPGGTYYVLVSTNMAASRSSWVPVLTNQFDNNGNFNFTNGLNTSLPQGFYIIQVK
jgi:fibronectin type 3 domain-containing protein